MTNFIEALNWRYAAKQMTGQAVPQEKVETILEAIRLAPTSSGLQPFEVLVITNPELKQQIQPIANNQPQIVNASHILVFAAWDNYTEERINEYFDRGNQERGSNERWEAYRNMLLKLYPTRPADDNFQHAARQAYIAFGLAIAAAALEQVDATPMEGFNAQALDELLGLPAKGLKSVTLLPLGYRDVAKDHMVNLKKIRRSKESLITELN